MHEETFKEIAQNIITNNNVNIVDIAVAGKIVATIHNPLAVIEGEELVFADPKGDSTIRVRLDSEIVNDNPRHMAVIHMWNDVRLLIHRRKK